VIEVRSQRRHRAQPRKLRGAGEQSAEGGTVLLGDDGEQLLQLIDEEQQLGPRGPALQHQPGKLGQGAGVGLQPGRFVAHLAIPPPQKAEAEAKTPSRAAAADNVARLTATN